MSSNLKNSISNLIPAVITRGMNQARTTSKKSMRQTTRVTFRMIHLPTIKQKNPIPFTIAPKITLLTTNSSARRYPNLPKEITSSKDRHSAMKTIMPQRCPSQMNGWINLPPVISDKKTKTMKIYRHHFNRKKKKKSVAPASYHMEIKKIC